MFSTGADNAACSVVSRVCNIALSPFIPCLRHCLWLSVLAVSNSLNWSIYVFTDLVFFYIQGRGAVCHFSFTYFHLSFLLLPWFCFIFCAWGSTYFLVLVPLWRGMCWKLSFPYRFSFPHSVFLHYTLCLSTCVLPFVLSLLHKFSVRISAYFICFFVTSPSQQNIKCNKPSIGAFPPVAAAIGVIVADTHCALGNCDCTKTVISAHQINLLLTSWRNECASWVPLFLSLIQQSSK